MLVFRGSCPCFPGQLGIDHEYYNTGEAHLLSWYFIPICILLHHLAALS